MNKKIYSVSQITSYIWGMFSQDYCLRDLSIKGEIGDITYWKDGTIYFSLKDDKSLIPCVCFKDKAARLKTRFEKGNSVVASGSVGVYKEAGKYQFYASSIEKEGQGELYARYLKLKEELEEMGLFAQEYKQQIPYMAKTVGIVTAPTGAAVRDIIRNAKIRDPFVQLVLYPAVVQGRQAPESIIRGIKALESYGVDVMIVGRGGGSLEDLWAFNDEGVARAIFDCSVPIISAVGHETDFTIADFVADLRAATPTEAAVHAVSDIRSVLERIDRDERRLKHSFGSLLRDRRMQAEKLREKLKRLSPQMRLNDKRQRSAAIEEHFHALIDRKLQQYKHALAPAEGRLGALMDKRLQRDKHRFAILLERFKARSPLDRLGGGYAYVSNAQGKGVSSAAELKKGELLKLRLKDGIADARIEDVRTGEGGEDDG